MKELFDDSGLIIADLTSSILQRYEGSVLDQRLIRRFERQAGALIGLTGLVEAAEVLEVSKQRIDQLRESQTFPLPEPLAQLRCGPIWLTRDLLQYNAERRQRL